MKLHDDANKLRILLKNNNNIANEIVDIYRQLSNNSINLQ